MSRKKRCLGGEKTQQQQQQEGLNESVKACGGFFELTFVISFVPVHSNFARVF